MEKKVYANSKSIKYYVEYGCTRASASFSTLDLARKYARSSPKCIGCCNELVCRKPFLIKRVLSLTYLSY